MSVKFVGLSASDFVEARETYRIVVERDDFTIADFELITTSFANKVAAFYNNMMGKTGILYPVSPNPVIYNTYSVATGEQNTYAIDVRAADSVVDQTITMADLVNRLNGVAPPVRVAVVSAIGADDVPDAAGRDALAQQVAAADSSVFDNVKSLVTLAVLGLAALAVIQVSKDL